MARATYVPPVKDDKKVNIYFGLQFNTVIKILVFYGSHIISNFHGCIKRQNQRMMNFYSYISREFLCFSAVFETYERTETSGKNLKLGLDRIRLLCYNERAAYITV